jgi:hypothetical protein
MWYFATFMAGFVLAIVIAYSIGKAYDEKEKKI